MIFTRLPFHPTQLVVSINLALLSLFSFPVQANPLPILPGQQPLSNANLELNNTQSSPNQGSPRSAKKSVPHARGDRPRTTKKGVPTRENRPRTTKKGVPRSPCPDIATSIIAIAPTTKLQEAGLLWEPFTSGKPTFWVYVPYMPEDIDSAKLALRVWDAETEIEETVYELGVTVEQTPGVIGISLPEDASLEPGKWYKWYFFVDVYCNPDTAPQKDVTDGIIKLEETASMSAEDRFWYDTLTAVARLQDNTLRQQEWAKLLRAIGLDKIVSEPIVPCCTLKDE